MVFDSRSLRERAANRPPIRRGKRARPLLAAAAPTIGEEAKCTKSLRFQQLLADVGAVVGRVGGEVGRAAIVVDEAHEPGVLHALGFGAHRRHEDLLTQWCAVLESDAVAPLGDPAHEADGPLRLFSSGTVVLEDAEPSLHLGFSEPRPEVVQDIVSIIAASTEPAELGFEYLGLENRPVRAPLRGKGRRSDLGRRHPIR